MEVDERVQELKDLATPVDEPSLERPVSRVLSDVPAAMTLEAEPATVTSHHSVDFMEAPKDNNLN